MSDSAESEIKMTGERGQAVALEFKDPKIRVCGLVEDRRVEAGVQVQRYLGSHVSRDVVNKADMLLLHNLLEGR